MAVAAAEDTLIYEGNKNLGIEGILTRKGNSSPWRWASGKKSELPQTTSVKSVTTLDQAGFHGPYLLALRSEPL